MSDTSSSRPFRLLGHPLHPMLVHVPLGTLILVPLSDAVALWSGRAFWWEASFWLLVVGLAGIVPAAIAGFVDYIAITDDSRVERTATRHMIAVMSAGALYLLRLLMHATPLPPDSDMSGILLCVAVCGCVALMIGGLLGGRLVHNGTVHGRAPGEPRNIV